MKAKLFLLAMCASAFTSHIDASIIKVDVSKPKSSTNVRLYFSDNSQQTIEIDQNGKGVKEITGFRPQYVRMGYGRSKIILYLDPTKDLEIAFQGDQNWSNLTFGGTGSDVNSYLNLQSKTQIAFQDGELDEKSFISKADSCYEVNLKRLNDANLPVDFVSKEKIRLKYFTYANFPLYTVYHAYLKKLEKVEGSEKYYEKLRHLTEYNPDFLELEEYRTYLVDAVTAMGVRGIDYHESIVMLRAQLEEIMTHVSDSNIQEYLTHTVVFDFVNKNGIEQADIALEAHKKYVHDTKMISAFNDIYHAWEKITRGSLSPDFSGEDMSGNTITLKNLKGKYIYIDVWATWCGPCRGELPHLKKLEEKFHGQPIEFVSLCCDQKKDAWKKMVEREQLKGVQLYIGQNSSFATDYLITGIPRFILLDKEGKIISANMNRPSDSETEKMLIELLNKK